MSNDVLAAVVGVEAENLEWELSKHLLDCRQHVRLGDDLHRGHHLPLGHAVHRVDVVQPLDAVVVALVHAVNADEARASIGRRCLAHTDVHAPGGPGLGEHHALRPVRRAVAQVVQVCHRDVAQPLEAGHLEHGALAAQCAGCGRRRQRAHDSDYLGQQRHVRGRVAPCEGVLWAAVVLHQRQGLRPAPNQPGQLRSAVAAQALQVRQHHPSVGSTELGIAEAAQHLLDPRIPALVILGPPELQRLGSGQHQPNLLQCVHLHFVHVDHHRFDDQHPVPADSPRAGLPPPSDSSQAHTSLESPARLQAHTSLDKTRG